MKPGTGHHTQSQLSICTRPSHEISAPSRALRDNTECDLACFTIGVVVGYLRKHKQLLYAVYKTTNLNYSSFAQL